MVPTPTRRRLLAGVGSLASVALAGCSSDSDDGTDENTDDNDGDESGSETDDNDGDESGSETDGDNGGGDDSSDIGDLDLREANVVGVEFERDGTSYEFSVTLHHDDDGEGGYANWWQVERLDGTRLGRRELLHPHSQQPFTRSETITVPAEVDCVVVRGHDQTHGYGGQAMVVNLEAGTGRAVDQAAEPAAFDGDDCP